MAEPLCPRCGRPIHDTAYVDRWCQRDLERALADVARVAGDITLTVARLSRVSRSGGQWDVEDERRDPVVWKPASLRWLLAEAAGALYPTTLPLDLDAARRHDAAVGELTTWARHIAEERGLGIHGSGHPLDLLAEWLTGQLDWLRHRPEAQEAYNGLEQACRAIVDVVDQHEPGELVGLCPCETFLYARAGVESTTCRRCGSSYAVRASREQMRLDLEQHAVTASEAARLAVYLGVIPDTGRLRKLIWDWCDRGHLEVVPEDPRYKGPPRYLLGHVLDRLMRTVAAKAA